MAATMVGAVAAVAEAAAAAVPPTVVEEEPVVAAIAEAKAMRTAMPPATHTAATTPAT
jgi:hypothetical protein